MVCPDNDVYTIIILVLGALASREGREGVSPGTRAGGGRERQEKSYIRAKNNDDIEYTACVYIHAASGQNVLRVS